jgi:hypothetical protein
VCEVGEIGGTGQRPQLVLGHRIRGRGSHDGLLVRYDALQNTPRVVSRRRRNPAEWLMSFPRPWPWGAVTPIAKTPTGALNVGQ